ncbi:MAG: hypothetical protein FJ356_01755 [Thaumarchaeota archaeon]|nr:hypothetical protein [Nitrososphaerota archaeon]
MRCPEFKETTSFFVMLTAVLTFSNLYFIAAQEDEFENIFLRLEFSPSVVESGNAEHFIGYVQVVDSEGSPVLAPEDLVIELTSSTPSIASVPSEVIISVNMDYVNFPIRVTDKEGVADITASFQGQELKRPFRVGGIKVDVPLNVDLELNIPTSNMHVGSLMPVSVFLNNSGTILQAPKDIKVRFEYERALLQIQNDVITIKQGDYYATTNIRTLDKTGTAFIKTITDEPPLENIERITVSSSLPKKLKVDVYPNTVIQKFDREIDIFVSLLDENNNPVKAEKDVPLEIFSNLPSLDDEFDKKFKNVKPVIKKGQWGFYYKLENFLFQEISRQNFVGVSSPGYGQARGSFNVLEELDEKSVLAENKTLALLRPLIMPPDSIGILVYQLSAIKGNDDDQDVIDELIALKKLTFHPFADDESYEEGDLYPIKSKYEDLSADALKARVHTTDESVIKVINGGEMSGKRTYGTAIIQSGEDGTATISVSVKGLASASGTITVLDDECLPAQCFIQRLDSAPNTITVLDPKTPHETLIFSPAGKNRIVFNNEGLADFYLVLLDSAKRPASSQNKIAFSVKPINELIEIPSKNNNVNIKAKSSSFARDLERGNSIIQVSPVGTDINENLGIQSLFEIAPASSTANIFIPFNKIVGLGQRTHQFGTIQLNDFFGNPVKVTNSLQVELSSNNTNLVQVPSSITIPAGKSFATFPIDTFGETGTIKISANVKGFYGSEATLEQIPFVKELVIFPVYPEEPITPGNSFEIQLFVDDENAVAVEGVELTLVPSSNATVFPSEVITDKNGESSVLFTAGAAPATLDVFASKSGYTPDQTTISFEIIAETTGSQTILGIPPLYLYLAIAGAAGGGGFMAFRILRKPKVITEEEAAEEEI